MTEIVGVIAALPALIQLSKSATKLALQLYNISQDAGKAQREIYSAYLTCRGFKDSVGIGRTTLNAVCAQHPDIQTVMQIEKRGLIDNIEDESYEINLNLMESIRNLQRTGGLRLHPFITSLVWQCKKKGILRTLPDMARIKGTLDLVLSAVNLDITTTKLQNLENRSAEEIKELKRQIRELESALETKTQTMQHLEAQREVKYHRPSTHGNTDRLRIDNFIDLVAEIREKSDRILEDVSSSRVTPINVPPSPISEVSTGRPSSSPHSQHSRSNVSPPTSPSAISGLPPSPIYEKELRTVRLDPDNFTCFAFCIDSERIDAMIDRSISENFIDLHTACQLHQVIEEPGDMEVALYNGVGSRPQRSIGIVHSLNVQLLETPSKPSVPVTMHVIENLGYKMIYGKGFAENASRRWGVDFASLK